MRILFITVLGVVLATSAHAANNPYEHAPNCGVVWDLLYPACPPEDYSKADLGQWRQNHWLAKGCLREGGSIRISGLECFPR